MKTLLLALSMVATLMQPIAILDTSYIGIGDYDNPNFFNFGYDLKYITDHFLVGVDNAIEVITNFADEVFPDITVKDINYKSPSVKYYDKSDHSTTNNFSYDIYNSFDLNYDNRSYAMFYDYNFDNRTYTYTYNSVSNTYENYDYRTFNRYTIYDDDEYLYVTNNNITNYEIIALNKIDPNANRYYSYYYELPSGSSSFNLTKEQVLGEFMSYDIYQYEYISDSDDILGLWHFDGNYLNEVGSDISISYDGNDFVDARFQGGIKLNGYSDMRIVGELPSQYTLEFWFFNNINNGTFNAYSSNAWHHMVRTYDNGTVRGWVDGNEVSIAKHESLSCSLNLQSPRILQVPQVESTSNTYGFNYTNSNRISESTSFRSLYNVNPAISDKIPSVACGVEGDLTIDYLGDREIASPTLSNKIVNVGVGTVCGSSHDLNTYRFGNTHLLEIGSLPSYTIYEDVDPNDPLHYYPLCSEEGVLFGFTGSSHTVPSKEFNGSLLHSSKDGYSALASTNPFVASANFIAFNGTNYIGNYPVVTTSSPLGVSAYTYDFVCGIGELNDTSDNSSYCDMSECIIDEMRLTRGLLYTDSVFEYPLDKFEFGHIFVRPSGDNYNVGDIAIQSTIPLTDYRIGGSDYTYARRGNVYIGLDNSIGVYGKIYDGRSWIYCDFGVWNGTQWVDGVGFNFSTLTWGDNNTNINIDINIDQDINVTDEDRENFRDLISTIGEWLGIIPLCITFCTFIPTPVSIIFGGILGLIAILIVIKLIKG